MRTTCRRSGGGIRQAEPVRRTKTNVRKPSVRSSGSGGSIGCTPLQPFPPPNPTIILALPINSISFKFDEHKDKDRVIIDKVNIMTPNITYHSSSSTPSEKVEKVEEGVEGVEEDIPDISIYSSSQEDTHPTLTTLTTPTTPTTHPTSSYVVNYASYFQPPKTISLDLHFFDGKMESILRHIKHDIERVHKIKDKSIAFNILRDRLVNFTFSISSAIRVFDVLVRTYENFTKDALGTPTLGTPTLGTSSNYDPTCGLWAEDLLYLIYETIIEENNEGYIDCFILQLSDMESGMCPQGRVTRLLQIIAMFDNTFI